MKYNISKFLYSILLLFLVNPLFAVVYNLGSDDYIVNVPSPTIMYSLGFTEMDGVTTPAANKGYVYLKSDGKLYQKNDAGTDYDLTAGGAGITDHTALTSIGTMTHDQLETQLTDIATDTTTLQGLIDALETSTGTLAISITDLEASTATLAGYITALWVSTSTLEGFIYDLWASTTTLEAAIALNTIHRTSDGSDHSFIDQDVTISGTPTFSTMTVIYGIHAGSITADTGTFGTITDGTVSITGGDITLPSGHWVGMGAGSPRFEMNGAEGRIDWFGGINFDGSDMTGIGNIHVDAGSGVYTDIFDNETAGYASIAVGNTLNVTGGVIVSTNVVCAKLDTGQGLNELYAMNQDVESTDAVTFLSVDSTCTYAQNSNLLDGYDSPYFLAWGNITSMPAGFQDGVDDVGGGGSSSLWVGIDDTKISSPTVAISFQNQFTGIKTGNTTYIFVSTAVPSNADTTHLCTADQIFNFCETTQDYLQESSATATYWQTKGWERFFDYDGTNYEVDVSTSVNITGKLTISGITALNNTLNMSGVIAQSAGLQIQTGWGIYYNGDGGAQTAMMVVDYQNSDTLQAILSASCKNTFVLTNDYYKKWIWADQTHPTLVGFSDDSPSGTGRGKHWLLQCDGADFNVKTGTSTPTIKFDVLSNGDVDVEITDSSMTVNVPLHSATSVKTASFTITDQYTLPTTDGTAGYAVTTDGAGQWGYTVMGAGGGGDGSVNISVDGATIYDPIDSISFENVFNAVANGTTVYMFVSTATPTNGDTTHLSNADQIFGFVDGSYLSKSSSTATNLHIDIAALTYEPIVTEGSLADSVIISADIKDATILYTDVSSTFTLAGSPNLPASRAYWATTGIIFEGATVNAFETLFAVTDPTADRTITFPNSDITVAGLASAMTGTYDGNNFGGGAIGQGDILYGSAAGTISELAKDANATRYLSNTGASNNPAWAQVNLANGVSGLIPVANIWGRVGTANSTVAAGTHTHTGVYEPVVTEGSLADSTIVSADIKDDTIDSADYAADSIDPEHLASNIDPGTDFAICISTPNALGTVATLISPFRNYAVTITTISMSIIGGTNFVGMIEQRTIAGIGSAGTDIWGGDVTALTAWIGGAVSDFTLPAGSGLFLVPTSNSGDVDRLMIKGRFTVD